MKSLGLRHKVLRRSQFVDHNTHEEGSEFESCWGGKEEVSSPPLAFLLSTEQFLSKAFQVVQNNPKDSHMDLTVVQNRRKEFFSNGQVKTKETYRTSSASLIVGS